MTTFPVSGVDVSQWQDTDHIPRGASLLIARASIGLKWDLAYDLHIREARRFLAPDGKGLVSDAYHFADNRVSIAAQVDVFIASAARARPDKYWLDVEGANAFSLRQTREFISRMHAKGFKCGLYGSLSGFMEAGQDWSWVAFWSPNPPYIQWNFWQYGPAPTHVDGDYYHGTLAQLRGLSSIALPDSSTVTDMDTTTTILPFGGRYTIPAGATFDGIKVDAAGAVTARKTWPANSATSSASYDALVDLSAIHGNPYLRCIDGFFAGFLVSTSVVTETANPAPAPTGFTQAQLDAAVKAAKDAGDAQITSLQASIDTKVAQAVQADRAKAQIKVVYE